MLTLKSPTYGLSDWDTKFFLEYNGNDYEFHTSCSDDLAEMNDEVNPQFTVLSYIDGSGNFCNQSASSCDCNGKMKEITINSILLVFLHNSIGHPQKENAIQAPGLSKANINGFLTRYSPNKLRLS